MADDNEEAEDERAIELSSIAAIYPELVIDPDNSYVASIEIPVEPIESLAIRFPSAMSSTTAPGQPTPPVSDGSSQSKTSSEAVRPELPRGPVQDIHHLSYLPHLHLSISLPKGYPTERPPLFHLEIEPPWLPEEKLRALEEKGTSMWENFGRDQVVFAYIDYLREAAERAFGLERGKENTWEASSDLKLALLDFDIKAKRAKFEQEIYDCEICLDPKKGAICHKMSLCGHVFCVACLQDFYTSCITEGDVDSVKCLAPKCGQENRPPSKRRKRDRTLDPSELLQIPLEQEKVQRYITLKRKRALESDRDTIYCPRQWCQGAARSKKTEALDRNLNLNLDSDSGSESESESESGCSPSKAPEPTDPDSKISPPADRLAICTSCAFAFCRVCKAGWHGEFYNCSPRNRNTLTAEEKASEQYMLLHTSPCPTCNAPSQKTGGCNHMICFKCNTHFCYLCSSWLDAGNPYMHFNNEKTGCYMRLWELEGGDGGDVGHGFGGGIRVEENLRELALEGSDSDDGDNEGAEGWQEQVLAPFAAAVAARENIVIEIPPPPRQPRNQQAPRAAAARPHPRNNQNQNQNQNQGLRRFLELARNDAEDEWDSDELDDDTNDDDDGWE
ncbi:MAG: hypothetical protein Q9190_005694 [Brigantiaea leucoxantha]